MQKFGSMERRLIHLKIGWEEAAEMTATYIRTFRARQKFNNGKGIRRAWMESVCKLQDQLQDFISNQKWSYCC